jgi:hypothetical protein
MRLSNRQYAQVFAIYLHLFRRRQFRWRVEHLVVQPELSSADAQKALYRELSETELRECIDDICEGLRGELTLGGALLDQDDHNKLKGDLLKKIMGPTRRTW